MIDVPSLDARLRHRAHHARLASDPDTHELIVLALAALDKMKIDLEVAREDVRWIAYMLHHENHDGTMEVCQKATCLRAKETT